MNKGGMSLFLQRLQSSRDSERATLDNKCSVEGSTEYTLEGGLTWRGRESAVRGASLEDVTAQGGPLE